MNYVQVISFRHRVKFIIIKHLPTSRRRSFLPLAYLDELNPFEKAYTLDISSLGAEKPLKVEKLNDYVGRYVHVHLINPIKGENIYEGDLNNVSGEAITITYRNKTRSIPVEINKENISKIRLAIKF